MSLTIYNTLSRRKEEFVPLSADRVGMYVCGVTVYDRCHIGHARSAMVFDVIYRYLMYKGYDVTYVRNYTDVDDKIIQRANEEGVSCDLIARRYIEAFDEDMAALELMRPTVEPRATAHIPRMIELVRRLLEKGHAYETPDGVYFSVRTFPHYGRLSGQDLDQMEAGARVEPGGHKRDPLDFALWKRSKPGEPWWESPWGPGRPGWHIECSVMSAEYLGQPFDIHGGGKDLIFPHHENEIAQSEAAAERPFAHYWIHNGWVTRDGVKMSKSLGNITTIRDALAEHHPEVLRLFFLSSSYRTDVDFTQRGVRDARLGLERLARALADIDALLECPAERGTSPRTAAELELLDVVEELPGRFEEAMDDDFNTALALSYFHEAGRYINRFLSEEVPHSAGPSAREGLRQARQTLVRLGNVLGLFQQEPRALLEELRQRDRQAIGMPEGEVLRLIAERSEARTRKEWAKADTIRAALAQQGIVLEDGPQGTTWRRKLDG